MRHGNQGKKFGRKRGPRKAFLKTLVGNLITKERMVTTETRAKEVKRLVERCVTHGKKQNLAALKLLIQRVPKQAAYKVYHDLSIRFKNRQGGYTKITKLAKQRKQDGAKMAIIEFVKGEK